MVADIEPGPSGSGPSKPTRVGHRLFFIAKTDFERDVVATASVIYKLLAQRPRDLDDVEGIFEARRLAGDELDWTFLDRWAAAWGIADRLAPIVPRFGSPG